MAKEKGNNFSSDNETVFKFLITSPFDPKSETSREHERIV